MAKKRTKHNRLNLPHLNGSKEAKARYNAAYWEKIGSKKRKKHRRKK